MKLNIYNNININLKMIVMPLYIDKRKQMTFQKNDKIIDKLQLSKSCGLETLEKMFKFIRTLGIRDVNTFKKYQIHN